MSGIKADGGHGGYGGRARRTRVRRHRGPGRVRTETRMPQSADPQAVRSSWHAATYARRAVLPLAAMVLAACVAPPPSTQAAAPASTQAAAPASQARDGRSVVPLTPDERDHVLGEMRDFLMALQRITDGLAREDGAAVAAAARAVGAGSPTGRMPPAIARKLPPDFRELARATHEDFDRIAAGTSPSLDRSRTLAQTAVLLQRCTTCHAAFRFP
jgi:cytochrome c556